MLSSNYQELILAIKAHIFSMSLIWIQILHLILLLHFAFYSSMSRDYHPRNYNNLKLNSCQLMNLHNLHQCRLLKLGKIPLPGLPFKYSKILCTTLRCISLGSNINWLTTFTTNAISNLVRTKQISFPTSLCYEPLSTMESIGASHNPRVNSMGVLIGLQPNFHASFNKSNI